MKRRRRILVHAQHLSGVGHLVRGLEIARAAARDCDVFFTSGGRPVARPIPERIELVPLPEISRGAHGLEAARGGGSPAAALRERAAALAKATAEIAPDVLVVEHYPFSKWELEPEIDAALRAARRANPSAVLVCSVRDVPRQTRGEDVAPVAWAARVAATLDERFDALLVHADPALTTLGEHFPGAASIRIPVHYTGYVSEKPTGAAEARAAGRDADGERLVVASSGGGAGSGELAERILEAWGRLAARGDAGGRRLALFTGAFWSDAEVARLGRAAAAQGAIAVPFSRDFLRSLARADLSISRAGYNTCTNVLELRVRALLVPDPRMSDQPFRAARLAERGLARVLAPECATVESLCESLAAALRADAPVHDLDLEGARRTSELLAELGPRVSGS